MLSAAGEGSRFVGEANKKGNKKIQWIEAVMFFAGSNLIMLAGSDFPPPAGFVWIVVIAGGLSVLQWFSCGWLAERVHHKGTFALTTAVSAALGAVIALLIVVFRGAAGADGSDEAAESAGTLAIAGSDIGIWIPSPFWCMGRLSGS